MSGAAPHDGPISLAEYRRMQRLPEFIANARRKLAALEREALRYGMTELVQGGGVGR